MHIYLLGCEKASRLNYLASSDAIYIYVTEPNVVVIIGTLIEWIDLNETYVGPV